MPKRTVICDYCGRRAVFHASSDHIHAGRNNGPIWHCAPCGAWVGCHKNTDAPLGRLADADLRKHKQAAHLAFDPLWRSKRMKRNEAYKWLAEQLGIRYEDCHIGMFDVPMCQRVVEVCHGRVGAVV